MMQAYMDIKNQYPDFLVFYRMGDFYELFFEDAVNASKYLGITLTQRGKVDGKPIPMAGIPFHASDIYIQKAINNGISVVICEQFVDDNPENKKGLMKREVAKIITPGTAVETGLIDDKEIKYIACVYKKQNNFDISWIDFASGEIFLNSIPLENINDEILKINPKEILISEKQLDFLNLPKEIIVKSLAQWEFDQTIAHSNLQSIFGPQYLNLYQIPNNNCITVLSALINYITSIEKEKINHIQNIRWIKNNDFIQINYSAQKTLELFNGNNSLFNCLDLCSTAMGSRTLKKWIQNPILDREILKSRLDRVDFLKNGNHFISWDELAQNWCDIERSATKIAQRSIRPRELATLRDTLRQIPKLKSWAECIPPHLKGYFVNAFIKDNVLQIIEKYLSLEPSAWLRDGNVIASGIDPQLDEARNLQAGGLEFLKKLEFQEKNNTGIPTLKVEYNSAQGFFISISNSHTSKAPNHYKKKQELKNCFRYTTEELMEYEEKFLSSQTRALQREKILWTQMLDKLKPYISSLQKQAKTLAEWDVLSCFAKSAHLFNYNRPDFQQENVKEFQLIQARHPVVEKSLENFVPIDIHIDNNTNLIIITGPNMGGKSTAMRTVALLSIMAHIGSFVPAKQFHCPTIDSIFTRIGAQDDLSAGQSTFMVEMMEIASILKNSTDKSLVLIDELGRGTSTFDGLSLAWSSAKHLAQNICCKTLFATHYLEMTDLDKIVPAKNYHVSATQDIQGNIVFEHLLLEGKAKKSYGIEVAKLAGVDPQVISCASEKLETLEQSSNISHPIQMNSLNNIDCSTIKNIILKQDLGQTTPMQALNILYELQQKIKNI